MGLTRRVLPPEEWPALAGTEAETLWPLLDGETARIVVVEDDGAIVGCWAAFPVVHVECVWVHERYRGTGSVVRRLLSGMREAVSAMGARKVFSAALTDPVRDLLVRLGGVLVPGSHYVVPMGER